MAHGNRLYLILSVLLEAPNHEGHTREVSSATGLDHEFVAKILVHLEEQSCVDSREGHEERLYYRLTEHGQHLARYTTRDGKAASIAIQAGRY